MRRTLPVLLVSALLALAACSSSKKEWDPEIKEEDGEKSLQLTTRREKQTGLARAGEWAYTAPINLVYWPWKVIGRGGRGAADGVVAGFNEGRMPIFGLVFSPVNLVTGLLTGMAEGVVLSPGAVTPDRDIGRSFARPTADPINVWWYD